MDRPRPPAPRAAGIRSPAQAGEVGPGAPADADRTLRLDQVVSTGSRTRAGSAARRTRSAFACAGTELIAMSRPDYGCERDGFTAWARHPECIGFVAVGFSAKDTVGKKKKHSLGPLWLSGDAVAGAMYAAPPQ